MKRMVFGESVQGASHKRVDKECQDSFKKLEYDDGTVIMAIADGHGSKACPYSKSGSSIAVNVFCKVMDEFHASYAENLEMLLTYLNREGDTKVAQAVDAEWKRRVLKVHTNQKREVLLTEDGEKNKAEIYKQYGSTLVGLMITPIFVFAFQLGDGDISYVDQNGLDHLLEDEKILGVETHSLSKIDSWKKVVSAVRRRDEADGLPYMLMLSTDGFANSYKNADEFQKTCVDYFAMIQQYGADAVAANLKSWLSETSAMGCGDDRFVSESPCRKSSSANSAPLAKAAIALTIAAQEIILRPAESRRAEALRLPAGSPEHTRSFISPRFIQNCNYGSSSLYLSLIKALFNFLRRKAVGQQVINIFRQIPECTCNIFEFPDIAVRAEYARMIGVEIQREIG